MMYSYYKHKGHGMTFQNISGSESRHSWDDWNLVPTSRPVINPPEAKNIYVDIPGADGQIDLTESLTGDVKYKNRIGSIEFHVQGKKNWCDLFSDIMDFLQGQQFKLILDDDPCYYYLGRFSVNQWKSEPMHSVITIDYNVEPYKLSLISSTDYWVWDTFNFDTGVIMEYTAVPWDAVSLGRSYSLSFYCERKKIVPTFTFVTESGDQAHFSYGGKNYYFDSGVSIKNPNIVFKQGYNTIHIWGKGTVTVEYRNGRL